MKTTALILFGHGARDREWAAPLQEIQRRILAAQPGCRVELAFLEFMAPTLEQAVDMLVVDGFSHVVVLPMFIAQGGHLKKELPEIIARQQGRHPRLNLQLTSAIGLAEPVLAAMTEEASRYLYQ